jgi:spore germination cell wall hydrolase CwlJ-like protein
MTSLALPKPLRLHLPRLGVVRVDRREAVGAAAVGVAVMLASGGIGTAMPYLPKLLDQGPAVEAADPAALPSLPATQIRALDPDDAMRVNAAIPLTGASGESAAPFMLGNASASARANAITCLTSAIYYEAGQENTDGQRAVAQVIINRVRHPAFPNSVCGVVYEGSTRATGCPVTFTCDYSMRRAPVPALWQRARKVAEAALSGSVFAPVGYATHYHANYVVPYWASSLVKTSVQGAHLFYRWPGGWGRASAFGDRWTGSEADPTLLRSAALAAPHRVFTYGKKPAVEGELAQLEAKGAEVTTEAGGRVRVRFSAQAREAVEKVKVTPYVEKVQASDNLRFALDGGETGQPAWGKPATTTSDSAK